MLGDLSIGGFALAVFVFSVVFIISGNFAIRLLKRKEKSMNRASKMINVVNQCVELVSMFVLTAGASAIGNVLFNLS